jgi:DNA replication licensing factor MCM5
MNLSPSRDQLRQNVLVKQYYCDIDIAHLITYNEELAHKLTTEPAEIIPLVCPQYKCQSFVS